MRASSLAVASALAAGALVGCDPTAPASPSFQVDVMPILAANCVRCHGFPSIGGAPHNIRFDSYDRIQVGVDNGNPVVRDGVSAVAADFAARLGRIVPVRPEGPMPPRFPLEPWQIDTLINWAGGANPPPRGEPRPGNQLPVLKLLEVTWNASVATQAYELRDPDGDLVVGQLCEGEGEACAFAAPLQSGRHQVAVDTTRLTPPFVLRPRVDDGAGVNDLPTVTLEQP